MKVDKWYKYSFEDGTCLIVRGLSAWERKSEEKQHGKLISKVFYGSF